MRYNIIPNSRLQPFPALHRGLISLLLRQALMVPSLTPQTRSPPIIAPPEFTVCVTCRPCFTTALVRVSKAFDTRVLLYVETPQRHLAVRRNLLVAIFNMAVFVFHPPSFRRHPLTSPSLWKGPIYCPAKGSLHTRFMSCGGVRTHAGRLSKDLKPGIYMYVFGCFL